MDLRIDVERVSEVDRKKLYVELRGIGFEVTDVKENVWLIPTVPNYWDIYQSFVMLDLIVTFPHADFKIQK